MGEREHIECRGGEVRLGQGITGLRLEDGRAAVSGPGQEAEYVVVAVEPRPLASLLPKPLRAEPFIFREDDHTIFDLG